MSVSQQATTDSMIAPRSHHQNPWLLVGGALALLGCPIAAARLDSALSGETDALLADAPSDTRHPFAETRSDARTRQRFREPKPTEPLLQAAAVSTVVPNGNDADVSPEVMNKARKFYAERCASCHGDQGNGDGPGAFAIKPKPRNYTDPEWQKSVTDEELAKAIVKGGAAVGKSYMMPASYDLRSKPELTAALVAMVRSFAQK